MDMTIINHQHSHHQLASIVSLLALLSFFYYLWVIIIRPRYIKTNNISFDKSNLLPASLPEGAGAWPLIGHLPQLSGSVPLFKILADMSDNYGPIFMVRFGMYPTLVVSSWEMTKECFTTNDRSLAGRPSGAASKYLTVGLFGFSYGSYWREIRKISTIQLLSHRRLELLKHVPYLEISNYMKHLHRRWMRSQNEVKRIGTTEGWVKVDMTQVFGELTLNVVLKLVIGKPLFVKNIADHDEYPNNDHIKEEEEGQKLHQSIIDFFTLAGVSVASDVLPFLGWLDVDGQKKQMKRVAREMDLIAAGWLEEHQQKRRLQTKTVQSRIAGAGSNDDDASDFMDVLISILDDEKDDLFFGYNRDTVIKATCLNLILGASDTTSIALTWVLSLLLTHQEVFKKAQNELDTVVGKERNVEGRDMNDLVYLQAIVKETLRLYPPAPLSVLHEAIEDCIIGGYKVRTGTRLLVNLWKLHRDPRVWSNPLEFKPERFLPQLDGGAGENTNKDFSGQDFEYLPFGSGRRMCPGINFACQTLHMVLARLLHAFDFSTAGLAINMTEGTGLSMPKLTPLEVHLHPRLHSSLY